MNQPDSGNVGMTSIRARLLAIMLLAASGLAAEEPKFAKAVYILPFAAAPGAQGADVFAGIGVQYLLENMLVIDGGLEENWALWQYRKLFPTVEDLEHYVQGQSTEPKNISGLTFRWLVRGRMLG